MSKQPSFRDLTELSAYLDGELSASARQKMEDRLARDPNLVATLDDLRLSRTVLRRTPQRRAPRNFTLSPQMVAKRPPMPRLVPALNYAALAAMLLFVFSFTSPFGSGANMMADQAVESAPMVAMEMEEMAAPAAEAPMEMAAEPAAADSAMEDEAAGAAMAEEEMADAEAPAEEPSENLASAPPASEATVEGIQTEKTVAATEVPADVARSMPEPEVQAEAAPLLSTYQRTLVILLGLFAILSWVVRQATITKWRKASK